MTTHGFILPPGQKKVGDAELMALPLDTIKAMSHKLSKYDYIKWKRIVLKEVLSDRANANDYSSDANERINFTAKALSFVEDELKILGEDDD